jgi:protein gp37
MNCWSARMADEFDRTPEPWTIANIDTNLEVYEENLHPEFGGLEPSWVFYPSGSDPFLPWIPDGTFASYWSKLTLNDHLVFQVLTKWGPEVERRDLEWDGYENRVSNRTFPDHVMLGVSVESPRREYRIDWLREQAAETKFVSFEPLVECIPGVDLDLSGIDWAIIGGESEQDPEHRREMDPSWARNVIRACRRHDVAVFFKQHSAARSETGQKLAMPRGTEPRRIEEFPELPERLPAAPKEFLDDDEHPVPEPAGAGQQFLHNYVEASR